MLHIQRIKRTGMLAISITIMLFNAVIAQTNPSSQPTRSSSAKSLSIPTDDAGRKLVEFVIDRHGGADKLAGIKSFRTISDIVDPNYSAEIDVVTTVQFPDSMKQVTVMGSNRTVAVFSAGGCFTSVNGQPPQPMPDPDHRAARAEPLSSMIYILQHSKSPDFQFHDGGVELIGVTPCRILIIGEPDERTARWDVDAAAGRILRTTTGNPSGQVIHHVTNDYTAWQTIDGIELSASGTTTVDSMKPRQFTSKHELNPPLSPFEFTVLGATATTEPASQP